MRRVIYYGKYSSRSSVHCSRSRKRKQPESDENGGRTLYLYCHPRLYRIICINRRKTPFFIGHTDLCTTNLSIWYFFGHETAIHFLAQETRVIRNLFIFIFGKVFLLELVVQSRRINRYAFFIGFLDVLGPTESQ